MKIIPTDTKSHRFQKKATIQNITRTNIWLLNIFRFYKWSDRLTIYRYPKQIIKNEDPNEQESFKDYL